MKIILNGWHSQNGKWFPAGTQLEVTDGERKEMEKQGVPFTADENPAVKETPATKTEAPAPAPRTRRKK